MPGLGRPRRISKQNRQQVAGMLAANARDVALLPEAELIALYPVLQEAKHELQAALREWIRDAPGGAQRFTAQHLRNALAHVNAGLRAAEGLMPVRDGLRDAMVRAGAKAGDYSVKHIREELARFSAIFDGSVHPVGLAEAALLAEGNMGRLIRYETTARRYRESVMADIRRQLAVGMARNETFDQMTNRLVRLGGPRGRVALRGIAGNPGAIVEQISEGLFRRYRFWAERIVRTEAVTAYNINHQRNLERVAEHDPEIMKRWDASIDGRVCLLCRGLDGEVVALDADFSEGVPYAPLHPN